MSKSWKIGLSIGVPILILIVLFFVVRLFMPSGAMQYAYDDMETMYAPLVGNATTEKSIQPMAMDGDVLLDEDAGDSQTQERLIIRTGNMSVVVEDVNEAVKNVMTYAEQNGGFVVYSNVYKSGLAPYGEVTVRVPSDMFDTATTDIKALGDVTSQSVSGQDVTEEYVDLDVQLKNLQAAEEQFLTIMKKAITIEDILAVQRELTRVQGNIERIEGRMKYLRESADMSSLTVYFSTDPDALPVVNEDDSWKPWAVVKNAARSLLVVAQWVADAIIFLVVFIPLWVVIGLVVWWIVKKVRRGNQNVNM